MNKKLRNRLISILLIFCLTGAGLHSGMRMMTQTAQAVAQTFTGMQDARDIYDSMDDTLLNSENAEELEAALAEMIGANLAFTTEAAPPPDYMDDELLGGYAKAAYSDFASEVADMKKDMLKETLAGGAKKLNEFGNWLQRDMNYYLQRMPYGNDYLKNMKMTSHFKHYPKLIKWCKKVKPGHISTAFDLYDIYSAADELYNDKKAGYNSSTLEFFVKTITGADGTAAVMDTMKIPGANIVKAGTGVIKSVVTNNTLVNFVNRNVHVPAEVDEFVDTLNESAKMSLMEWFFSGSLKQAEENEKLLEEMKQRMRDRANGGKSTASGINVYKPNIYLYAEQETAFTVEFARPQLLTVTDPIYQGMWSGHTVLDGSIIAAGAPYGFLFYESLTYPAYYQRQEGFTITCENREEQFAGILQAYGLNEQEIADFIEFWRDKLEADRTYAMYPQMTEVIDRAMPVTITPAPDSVFRIWFAFVPEETPEKAAQAEKFARDGFTVVEWGGFFLDGEN